jgi:hypothetical protein
MRIDPDGPVATDGPFEIGEGFDRDGYLQISAGAYDGYVMLNREQANLAYRHLGRVLDEDRVHDGGRVHPRG